MLRRDALELADELLYEHGLFSWTAVIDPRPKRRLGQCRYEIEEIGLSEWFVKLNGEHEVRQTILHEIAHALVGPGYGHGRVWKAKCRAIGGRFDTCSYQGVEMPAYTVYGVCDTCGLRIGRYRRPPRGQYVHADGHAVLRWEAA